MSGTDGGNGVVLFFRVLILKLILDDLKNFISNIVDTRGCTFLNMYEYT